MKGIHTTVIALVAAVAAACGDSATAPIQHDFRYDLTVTGAVQQTLRGPALFGSETSGGGSFVVVMGSDTSTHTIVLARAGSARPAAGTYAITEAGSGTGWEVLYVIGEDDELAGLFLSRSGTLVITESTQLRLRGTIQFDAVGYLGDDIETEVEVSVQGSFDARNYGG